MLARHPHVTKTLTRKFESLHSMGAYKTSGGMDPLILNLASLVFESPGLDKMSDKNK